MTRPRPRLRPKIEPVSALSPAQVETLWQLFSRVYDRASRERFVSDLQDKHDIVLLERQDTGALSGFTTLKTYERSEAGRPCRVLYSGDTVVDPEFWGDKALQAGFNRYLVRLVLSDPFTPLWWMLTTKGYRTYLLLTNYFSESYPRFDRTLPPEVERLRRELGERCYASAYDPATGIVRHGGRLDRVQPGLVEIGERERRNPHIAYFERQNPGHVDGDELLCLARVRWRDPVRIVGRLLTRRLRSR